MDQRHANTAQDRLAPLVRTLHASIPNLIAIYLFGSFGTANERSDSDIDLGLQAAYPLDPVVLFHLAGELATHAGRDVDLVDMLRCSTVMRAQIIASGEVVFCTDEYRCEDFAATAWSQYAHLNEARRGILDDIRARGSVHG